MARSVVAVAGLLLATGCLEKVSTWRLKAKVPSDLSGLSNALFQSAGVTLTEGHQVELVNNGTFFDALDAEMKRARSSIHIVVFIWRPGDPSDRLVPTLVERARAGVACRILVDHLGSLEFEEQVKPTLEAAGCEVHVFRHLGDRPSLDRNHRKIFVVDGQVGFTGGVGIFKVWLGNGVQPDQWRDSNVRVRGPVVAQMQQAFAENWTEHTGTFLPAGAFPPLEPAGPMRASFVASGGHAHVTKAERLSQLMIAAAKERVWIGNAYFLPSPGMFELLIDKRREGVDVRVMTPSDSTDHPEVLALQRGRYPELLEAGVRIFEYRPTMYHPKTMLVDDALSVVGSINFDKLSQDWLEEGSLVVHDQGFAAAMERDWLQDATWCREVTP
jgi:cardiolipin synthase A/B